MVNKISPDDDGVPTLARARDLMTAAGTGRTAGSHRREDIWQDSRRQWQGRPYRRREGDAYPPRGARPSPPSPVAGGGEGTPPRWGGGEPPPLQQGGAPPNGGLGTPRVIPWGGRHGMMDAGVSNACNDGPGRQRLQLTPALQINVMPVAAATAATRPPLPALRSYTTVP